MSQTQILNCFVKVFLNNNMYLF